MLCIWTHAHWRWPHTIDEFFDRWARQILMHRRKEWMKKSSLQGNLVAGKRSLCELLCMAIENWVSVENVVASSSFIVRRRQISIGEMKFIFCQLSPIKKTFSLKIVLWIYKKISFDRKRWRWWLMRCCFKDDDEMEVFFWIYVLLTSLYLLPHTKNREWKILNWRIKVA